MGNSLIRQQISKRTSLEVVELSAERPSIKGEVHVLVIHFFFDLLRGDCREALGVVSQTNELITPVIGDYN